MEGTCKTIHLLLSELNYELRIRKVTSDRPHDEKRKILGRLWTKERQQGLDLMTLVDPSYDFNIEKVEIDASLNSIANLICEFEGSVNDSSYKRATTRLCHITLRIQRIKLVVTDENYEEILKFKNESYATSLKLEADLHDKIIDEDCVNLNSTVLPSNNVNTTCNHSNSCNNQKYFPVYKLGVQFDGESTKLLSFIEKVEELALSRNISKKNLFDSASDLFSGKAIFWFRHIKSSVNDWDSLILKLKQDFLQSDIDDEIWHQIRNRKQGKNEPAILFISCLEALFNRLSHQVAEVTKVKYLKLGLHQTYRDRLALIDIDSVITLGNLCKKLEENMVIPSTSMQTKNVSSLVDPELAYVSDNMSVSTERSSNCFSNSSSKKNKYFSKSRNQNSTISVSNNTNSEQKSTPPSAVICWKCKLPNHTFRSCKAKINKKFCFKCGLSDVTLKNCSNCNQGNEQRR